MSQIDPLLKPEEEEEENHDDGKRAFFAGVFKTQDGGIDGFTGAFRGVPARKRGGQQTVFDDDTIGAEDLCWCGQPQGHSWPGKASKRPHPRGDQVSAMADEKPYLNPRDLRAFNRKVVRALCDLVNKYGVDYKILSNGVALVLIPPDAEHTEISERLKVSAARPPEGQLKYIEQWAIKHVRPAKVEEATAKLAEKFNDPNKKPHPKTVTAKTPEEARAKAAPPRPPTVKEETDRLVAQTRRRSEAAVQAHARKAAVSPATPAPTPQPTSKPAAPQAAATPASQAPADKPPAGFEQYIGTKGEPLDWWKKIDADEWRCKRCGHVAHSIQGMGGHGRAHSDKAAAANVRNAKNIRVKTLLIRLAEEAGVDLGINSTAQTRELEKMKAKYETVVRERDELRARLDLILEASRA